MKIIDSKLQGNVLQEFTDDYLEKHKELIKYVKEETKKQLTLTDVSQQLELLVAWEKRRYSLEEWKIVEKISIEFIDDWLSN
jgi:hypothetical protein